MFEEKFVHNEKLHILATSEEEERYMSECAKSMGNDVRKTTVWDGIVPPNSYMPYGFGVRMSTPEYFLFRKMARSNDIDARTYACEMFGHVGTSLTCTYLEDGEFVKLDEPRLTVDEMLIYLTPVADDRDARRVARLVMGVTENLIDGYERFVSGCYNQVEE